MFHNSIPTRCAAIRRIFSGESKSDTDMYYYSQNAVICEINAFALLELLNFSTGCILADD